MWNAYQDETTRSHFGYSSQNNVFYTIGEHKEYNPMEEGGNFDNEDFKGIMRELASQVKK